MDINDTLDFNHSVDVLSYSAGRALGAMTSKYYQADGLDYDTYTKMYESLVTPIMDYGCEIWGYETTWPLRCRTASRSTHFSRSR